MYSSSDEESFSYVIESGKIIKEDPSKIKMNAKLSLLEFVGLIPCDRQITVSLYHCNPQSPYTLNKQLYFTIIITHFCGDGMIQHDDMSSTIKIF